MENFNKYIKIKLVGDEENKGIFQNPNDDIVIQEKMDGANSRFMITKDLKVIFGSRTQQLTSDEGEDENINKNFENCVRHIRDKIEKLENKNNLPENFNNYVFYGECMIKHTMDYDWDNIPIYLGFDILDTKNNVFLNYKKSKLIFENLGFSFVPIIEEKKAKDIGEINEEIVPISKYPSPSAKDQRAEGVIFKNYNKQIFAKFVREKFKEKNREVFGGSKKYAKTDEEFFVMKYCTNQRIEKSIFKLIDEGNKLEIALMGSLVHYVYKDIWEENLDDLIFSKRTLNLNNMKKLVSKRCLNVLKQVIINNKIGGKNE